MNWFARHFFPWAGRTPVLLTTFTGMLLMMLLVFPALPVNAELIDLKLSYTLADIQTAMVQYGPVGRRVYAWASPTVDTLFPLFYVTFFAGFIYRFRPQERLGLLAWIAVLAGVWDLCENAQITALLLQYPDISARQVAVASFFTTVKHLLSAVYEITALVFLVLAVRRHRRATVSGAPLNQRTGTS